MWWVSAALTYVVLVGFVTLVIKMTRRPEIPGLTQSSRNDQFAGFLVGAVKGFLIAAFAAAGIQNYGTDQIKMVAWADEQVKTSWAMKCNDEYRPAARIWASRPVRHFVSCVRRMGLQNPSARSGVASLARPRWRAGGAHSEPRPRTECVECESSRRCRGYHIRAKSPAPEPGLQDLEKTVAEIKAELKARANPN